jgi:hypothetical protein
VVKDARHCVSTIDKNHNPLQINMIADAGKTSNFFSYPFPVLRQKPFDWSKEGKIVIYDNDQMACLVIFTAILPFLKNETDDKKNETDDFINCTEDFKNETVDFGLFRVKKSGDYSIPAIVALLLFRSLCTMLPDHHCP